MSGMYVLFYQKRHFVMQIWIREVRKAEKDVVGHWAL